MFAYFRSHRRNASGSAAAPAQPGPTQRSRPVSSATIGSDTTGYLPSVPPSPATKSMTSPRSITSHRFYTRNTHEREIPEVVQEEPVPAPVVSSLPPVLPPIPRIAESVKQQQLDEVGLEDLQHQSRNLAAQAPVSPSINYNPLRLNAVPKNDTVPVERPNLQLKNLSTIAEQPTAIQQQSVTSPPLAQRAAARKEDKYRRPISLAYQLDFGQGFVLDDESPLGQGDFRDVSKPSTKASSPSSPTARFMISQPTSPRSELDALNFSKPVSNQTSSPASSYSSCQKSASSTNLAAEALPMSSSTTSTRGASSVTVAPPTTILKTSKPRRSLLNPVSLLMRRKTANSAELLAEAGLVNKHLDTATSVPDTYDPRIKGKGVHDFNAPRPRRNYSTNDLEGAVVSMGDVSPVEEYKRRGSVPWAPPHFETVETTSLHRERSSEHTPVFFENFEGDTDSKVDEAAVHRETLANQAFLARAADNGDLGSDMASSTRKNSNKTEEESSLAPKQISSSVPAISVTPDRSRESSPEPKVFALTSGQPLSVHSKLPTPPSAEVTSQLLLPREHRASNASRSSRFSFQFADEYSAAQEHALEEKHKQKAAEKASIPRVVANYDETSSDDDDDDDGSVSFDEDDDNNAAFEELVPGVNADVENTTTINISRPEHVNTVSAPLKDCQSEDLELPEASAAWPSSLKKVVEGLPITLRNGSLISRGSDNKRQATHDSNHSDEMYFDDGLIEPNTTYEPREFDESIFDSPIKSPEKASSPMQIYGYGDFDRGEDANSNKTPSYVDASMVDERHGEVALGLLPGETSGQLAPKDMSDSSQNLEAYHSALATAATEAHAAGKFKRDLTEDGQFQNESEFDDGQYEAVEDSNDAPTHPGPGVFFNWDEGSATPTDWPGYDDIRNDRGFEDDDYEDDPMIAAANAEALAADDSGFYGREFDFFSNGKPGNERFNGGFFRDSSKSGLGRTSSVRDPTLTPITERSEFSRAPSYMSLNTFGNLNAATVAPPLPSPGLKELAARFGLDHDDMTLKQLVKLRKETFTGGTAGSSGTSPSSYSSSPLLMKSPTTAQPKASTSTPKLSTKVIEEMDDEHSNVLSGNDVGQQSEYAQGSPQWDGSETASPSPISPGIPQVARMWPVKSAGFGNSHEHSHEYSSDSLSSASTGNIPALPASEPTVIATATPMPSSHLMQKFAARPPASSATYAERQADKRLSTHHQRNGGAGGAGGGVGLGVSSDSVAYVREDDGWFMEKRRTLGNGEVVVLARELVEGGRI